MMIAIGSLEHDPSWKPICSFYAFDIPVAGTVAYQLQHCLRSIYSTAANIPRHRLTTQESYLPWEFRMTIYVFPADIEDVTLTSEPTGEEMFYNNEESEY